MYDDMIVAIDEAGDGAWSKSLATMYVISIIVLGQYLILNLILAAVVDGAMVSFCIHVCPIQNLAKMRSHGHCSHFLSPNTFRTYSRKSSWHSKFDQNSLS